jgi:ligand-binding SRPBCC domain-containing protein
MRMVIRTRVEQPYREVARQFSQDLFKALNPPFPPVRLQRFDGSKAGDEVHLELNFLLFRQRWVSVITADHADEREIYFIDEGKKLPFFLRYWRHRHRIINEGTGTRIVDDITFRTPFRPFDFLMYPLMYLQFLYRKPVYKRFFRKIKPQPE